MAESYKIARLYGIDIEVHWTLILLIFFTYLISVYYSSPIFILIVLLFVCVLIHELSHSVVALKNNVGVRRIILMPLGGASIIDQLDMHPKVEFNIAVAGPLMSLLLAAIFGLLVTLAPEGALTYLLQFLFLMNLLLGAFNLLPAFPTDGGRVLRSYLERRYDSYKATMLTIKASNYVMGLLVLGTIVYVVVVLPASVSVAYKEFVFLWTMLIILFLFEGAQAEKQLIGLKRDAAGVSLRDVVSRHFSFVDSGRKLHELYGIMKKTKKHLFITRVGRDYAFVNLLGRAKLQEDSTVSDVARPIPSVDVKTNLVDALEMLESGETGIAAITSNGKLAGVVTLSHLQTFLSLHVLKKRKESAS